MHQNLGFARSFSRDQFRDGEPFMAFLITLSNHHPYDLPEHHRRLDVGGLDGTIAGRYLQSVNYSIGRSAC